MNRTLIAIASFLILACGKAGADSDWRYCGPHTIHFPKEVSVGEVTICPKNRQSNKEIIHREAKGDIEITTISSVTFEPSRDHKQLALWQQIHAGDITEVNVYAHDLSGDSIVPIIQIARESEAKNLSLLDCRVTTKNLEAVCGLKELRKIIISRPQTNTDYIHGLAFLDKLPHLEGLGLGLLSDPIPRDVIQAIPVLKACRVSALVNAALRMPTCRKYTRRVVQA